MTSLILFSGIVVNSLIVIILLSLIMKIILKPRSEKLQGLSYGTFFIIGLLITSLGTLLLYLQQGMLQISLTTNDTVFPNFLWIGYYIASFCFFSIFLKHTQIKSNHKYIAQSIVIILFLISSLGMFDFVSLYNGGAILVIFQNSFADYLGSLTSLIIGAFALSTSIERRIEYLQSESCGKEKTVNKYTSNLVILSLLFILQFSVPRVTTFYGIGPLMIKAIGFLLIVSLCYLVYRYQGNLKLYLSWKEITEIHSEIELTNKMDLLLLTGSIAVVAVYGIVSRIDVYVPTVEEKISAGYPILYLGNWLNYDIFADFFGAIIPFVLALSVVIIILLKRHDLRLNSRFLSIYLGMNLILSILLSILSTPLDLEGAEGLFPRFTIFPFIVSPVLAYVLSYFLETKYFSHSNKDKIFSGLITPIAFMTYCSSTFAAFMFDIIIARSSYGIIHLGAAGLLDGLFWVPLLSTAFVITIQEINKILKIFI